MSRVTPERVSIVRSARADIAKLVVRLLRQEQQHLVVARGQPVLVDQIGVQHAPDGRVAQQVAAPCVESDAFESRFLPSSSRLEFS